MSSLDERVAAWMRSDEELRGQVAEHRRELAAIVRDAKRERVPASAVAESLGISRQGLSARLARLDKR